MRGRGKSSLHSEESLRVVLFCFFLNAVMGGSKALNCPSRLVVWSEDDGYTKKNHRTRFPDHTRSPPDSALPPGSRASKFPSELGRFELLDVLFFALKPPLAATAFTGRLCVTVAQSQEMVQLASGWC